MNRLIALGLLVWGALAQAGAVEPGAAPASRGPLCPKSSPEDIVRSYRLVWGPVSEERGIGRKESCAIMDRLLRHGAACGLPPPPAEVSGAFLKCPSREATFALVSFLTGRDRVRSACREYFRAAWRDNGLFDEDSFCAAILAAAQAGGLGDVCPQLGKYLPPGVQGSLSGCRKQFPYQEKDCGKKKECRDIFALNAALQAQRPEACPEGYKALCARKTRGKKDPAPLCDKARKDLQDVYCALYEKAHQRTRGQIGMTDAQLKAVDEANREIKGRERSSR